MAMRKNQKNQVPRPTEEELVNLMRVCLHLRDNAKLELFYLENCVSNPDIQEHHKALFRQYVTESNAILSVLKYFGVPGPEPMQL